MRTKPLSKRMMQAGTMMLSAKTAPPRCLSIRLLTVVLLALLTGQSVWADDGGNCGRSNVNGGNNVKWEYTAASGTLRIYPNTTDPSGTDFGMKNYDSWTPAPWNNYRENITTLIVDNGVQSVGNCAMDGCTALTSENITIAASVTNIRSYAFRGCTDLTTAPIGSGVTQISTFAFQNCTGLTSATIPASVTDFNCTAFDGCTSLTDITVAADNPNYKDVDGVMMSKDGTTLIRYPEGKTATSYTIPDGVTTIDTYAFKNNTHLTTVTIPEDVTTINNGAFYYCTSLASVTIPETITTINGSVFYYCTSLTSVTIPASVTEIKYRAFGYCTALTSVYLMSATLPMIENVSGYYEFENVNANCHFYHYGTAYNSGDWTTMWSQMASNDPAWTGTHTVIGSVALPTNVTAATAVLTYDGTDYFASGATVTLSHTDRTGYTFDGYTAKDADNGDVIVTETSGDYIFEMPASDVTVTAEWKKLLTNADITIADIPSQEYTGSALTPVVTITDGSTPLTEDTHYTVTLPEGRINTGDYTITLTGIGTYAGTETKTFTITPKVTNYGCLSVTETGTTITAAFDGTSLATVSIPSDIVADAVTLNRTFTSGTAVTLMLPFSLGDGQTLTGGTLYKFSGVSKDANGKWQATMTETTTLKANTPYVMMPNDALTDNKITFGLNGSTVTLNTTTAGENSVSTDVSADWDFLGTYEERHWYDGTDGEHAASNADEIGTVYGFAATGGKATDGLTDISAGQFVRFANGAWLRPMRCYLKYKGTGNPLAASRSRAPEDLPESITVKLVGINGTTTEIGTFTVVDDSNGWYSLEGRRISGKPSKKGLYIHNGSKVVVK